MAQAQRPRPVRSQGEQSSAEKTGEGILASYSNHQRREYLTTHYESGGSFVNLVLDNKLNSKLRFEKPSFSETFAYFTPEALEALEGRILMQERWIGNRLVERKYYIVRGGELVELSYSTKKDLRGFYDELNVDGKTYKVYRDKWEIVEATNS